MPHDLLDGESPPPPSDGIPHAHPPGKALPSTGCSRMIETIVRKIGEWSAWAWVILMAIIILNVFMRYALGEGRIEFEELQWHVYALGFLLALSYCYIDDGHVRVDLLHHRWSLTTQAWFELFGILIFLLPFIGFLFWHSIPFVVNSYEINETSGAPGGLPFRWAIKAILPFALALLLLVIFARLTKVLAWIFNLGGRRKQGGHSHGN